MVSYAEVFSFFPRLLDLFSDKGFFFLVYVSLLLSIGLCHISQITSDQGRVVSAQNAVKRGQRVFVRVQSIMGSKISLSMRDVNQATGADEAVTSVSSQEPVCVSLL